MKLNDPTHAAIGAAMKVHRVLGPGLLEPAYEASDSSAALVQISHIHLMLRRLAPGRQSSFNYSQAA